MLQFTLAFFVKWAMKLIYNAEIICNSATRNVFLPTFTKEM
jgi:hypothetical protein